MEIKKGTKMKREKIYIRNKIPNAPTLRKHQKETKKKKKERKMYNNTMAQENTAKAEQRRKTRTYETKLIVKKKEGRKDERK